jgi:hypothetical protein
MEPTPRYEQYGAAILSCSIIMILVGSLLLFPTESAKGLLRTMSQTHTPERKESEYASVFPPSQRKLLPVSATGPNTTELSRHPELLLGLEMDYRLASPWRLLFSGFSVGEVRALGSFPNYAALSEVPLPVALTDFDINTARPRPYRPLRWPYHQTMGKPTAGQGVMGAPLTKHVAFSNSENGARLLA